MNKVQIIHNPRCSKSRQTLEILNDKKVDFEIIEYLNGGLDKKFLECVLDKLGKKASEVLRTKEDDYKNASIDWNDNEAAIEQILKTPKVLERPIVINGDKAIVARPPELVLDIL